jgi:hypothetical protein
MRSRKNIVATPVVLSHCPLQVLVAISARNRRGPLADLDKSQVIAVSLIRRLFLKKSPQPAPARSRLAVISGKPRIHPFETITISQQKPVVHHSRRMACIERGKSPARTRCFAAGRDALAFV